MDAMNNADHVVGHDLQATIPRPSTQKPVAKRQRKNNKEKLEIIEMLKEPGTTIAAVSRESGVHESTIRGWISKEEELRRASDGGQKPKKSIVPDPVATLTDLLLSWCQEVLQENPVSTLTSTVIQDKALEIKQEILGSEIMEISTKERNSLEKFKACPSWAKTWMIRHNLRDEPSAAAVGEIRKRKMLSSGSASSSAAQRLRNLIYSRRRQPKKAAIALPGVHDALSAKIYATEGAEALFVSGFGVSASRLGVPDAAGIITRSEMEDTAKAILTCLQSHNNHHHHPPPLIVDVDTSYGGAANVRRTVRSMAALGVAAISIQDEAFPKQSTFSDNANIVNRQKAFQRIKTALQARDEAKKMDGNDILVIAKTTCRGALGFEEAVARCKEFEKMGADIIYAKNFQDAEEYDILRNIMDSKTSLILSQVQLMKDQTDGLFTLQDIGALGFDFALLEMAGLQSVVASMKGLAKEILGDQRGGGLVSSASNAPMASFEEVKECLGFPEMEEFECKFPCE